MNVYYFLLLHEHIFSKWSIKTMFCTDIQEIKLGKIKRILNHFILIFLTNIKFIGNNILYISGFNLLFLSFPIIHSKGKKGK